MKRVLVLGGVSVVLVLVILAVTGLAFASKLVRKGVAAGSEQATGLSTKVGGADLAILGGRVALGEIVLENPEGFEGSFLVLGGVDVGVRLPTLREEVVEIPLVRLDDLTVTLAQDGARSNFGPVLKQLKASSGKKAPKPGGRGFIIRRLEINNVTARIALDLPGGISHRTEVQIPQLVLEDLGAGSESGATLASVSGILVGSVLEAAARKGALPGGLGGDLLAGLRSADLGRVNWQTVGDIVAADPGKPVKNPEEAVKSGIKKLLGN